MNLQDLQTLLDYHYWARDRLLDALEALMPEQFTRDMGSSLKSIRDTVAHVYAAEWAWYKRWQADPPTALLPADLFPDVASLRVAWTEHETKMKEIAANAGIGVVAAANFSLGVALFGLLWVLHPEYVDLLTKHPKGATLITAAVVMGLIGILWIRKLVRIDV